MPDSSPHRPRRAPLLIALALCAALLVPAATSAAKRDRHAKRDHHANQHHNRWQKLRVLNIAHQGGEDEFPSNTMYAFKRSLQAGADMLELDIGVTRDGHVVVMHDTSVDRTTNGHGFIKDKTLKQIERLDGAYWFHRSTRDPYSHDRRPRAYRYRGIATGKRKPPKHFKRSDFRVPTLRRVLRAFPRTPINIEIKARDNAETDAQYVRNANALARTLRHAKRKRRLNVASFNQAGLDRFHKLMPRIALAPATAGAASYLLGGGSPGPGIKIFQMPITFDLGGQTIPVTTAANVARAHRDGYAWQVWFSGTPGADAPPTWRKMLRRCVDGIMTARPQRLEKLLDRRHIERPGKRGVNPCRSSRER